jgi:hypothetical protein
MLPNFEAMFAKWKDYTSNTLRYGCIMLNEELTKMVLVCNWNVSYIHYASTYTLKHL